MMMKSKMAIGLPLLLLAPTHVFSHVRWFVDEQQPTSSFTLDTVSILLGIGTLLYCSLCYLFNVLADKNSRHFPFYHFLFEKFDLKGLEWKIFETGIAVMLIGNMITGIFVAPNLVLGDTTLVLLLQGALVICLVFDRTVFSVALLALVGTIITIFGIELAIDYAPEFISFAIALALVGIHATWLSYPNSGLSRHTVYITAASVLRIGMGLQLAILAIHNKLLNPDLGLSFLQLHPEFNFMQLLGVTSFEGIHFVLAAGLAETSFGLLLIFNIATRFVATCVLGIFTLTSIVMGLHELLGHLPVLAAMFVVWLNGNATTQFNVKLFTQAISQNFNKSRLLQN